MRFFLFAYLVSGDLYILSGKKDDKGRTEFYKVTSFMGPGAGSSSYKGLHKIIDRHCQNDRSNLVRLKVLLTIKGFAYYIREQTLVYF